jgi:hypothetical protein
MLMQMAANADNRGAMQLICIAIRIAGVSETIYDIIKWDEVGG